MNAVNMESWNFKKGRGRDKKRRKRRRDLSRLSPFRKSNEAAVDRFGKAAKDYINRNAFGNAVSSTIGTGIIGAGLGAGVGLIRGRRFNDPNRVLQESAMTAHKWMKRGAVLGLGASAASTILGNVAINDQVKKIKKDPKKRGQTGSKIRLGETILGGKFGKKVKLRRRDKKLRAVGPNGELYL